jgi:Recombination endonuclease VII
MPYASLEDRREARRKYRREHPEKRREQKRQERLRRGVIPRGTPKTHCRAGHEMTPENTYVEPKIGKRKCKLCKKLSNKRAFIKHYVPHPKAKKPPEALARGDGWTIGMFEVTLAEQGNRCAICRLPFDRPCADHKHSDPPEPRGILCNGCNTAIGLLKENPEVCRAAAEYLEAWTV